MITVFLPCRKGSERVKNKNHRKFCLNTDKSLFDIKIEQLLSVTLFDKIIVSTNDPIIICTFGVVSFFLAFECVTAWFLLEY